MPPKDNSSNAQFPFTEEGDYDAAYKRYSQYAVPGPYTTKLTPKEERAFYRWLKQQGRQETKDYDMRGYWKDVASKGQDRTGINPLDQKQHYPDTYKTPYDTNFSGESKYAKPGTPLKWLGGGTSDERLVNTQTGQTEFQARPKGVPSPEQEALQEPAIDPTFLGGVGLSEGGSAAAKLLATLLGQTWIMNRMHIPKHLEHIFNEVETPKSSGIAEEQIDKALQELFRRGGEGTGAPGPSGLRYTPTGRNYASGSLARRALKPVTAETLESGEGPGLSQKALMFLAKKLAEKGEFGAVSNQAWDEKLLELMKNAQRIPVLMGE